MIKSSKILKLILITSAVFLVIGVKLAFAEAAVSYGQTVSDFISVAGERDEFTFSGATGDVIILPFTKISGDFNPYVELFDPQGRCIAYSGSGMINATLPATGDFKITVRDYNDTHTGNYQFSSQFSANAGDTLYIPLPNISPASNSFTPYLELYDSSGTRLADSSNGTLTATVPLNAGSYYFYLTDSSRTGTGAYEFTLERTNNPQNFKDLSHNSIIEDSLEAATGINIYRFTADANDKITICSAVETETSGDFSSYLELYDTAGRLLASGPESLKYTFADSGTFYLFISAYSHSGTGTYKFILLNGDVSCSNSGLINPRVSLLKPQAGQIIEAGSTYKIRWTSSDDKRVVSQQIWLSLNSGVTYPTGIVSGLRGDIQSYDWLVPADLSTNRARIKVIAYDAQEHQGEDAVKADFTIIKTTLPANSVNIDYGYDSLSRLINSTAAFATYLYTYDALNRLSLSGQPNDTTPPTGSIKINNGAQYTSTVSVTLNLSASDAVSGMGTGSQMQFSNNRVNWSAPEAYAVTKTWQLASGRGQRTVYVKFKDVAGNWSGVYSDSIILRANQPPVARITAIPTKGKSPLSVQFYGNRSTDPDEKIVSYSWRFGDGAISTLTNPRHTFKNTPRLTTKYFTVTLTVKDNSGATSSSKTTITVYPRKIFPWKIFQR